MSTLTIATENRPSIDQLPSRVEQRPVKRDLVSRIVQSIAAGIIASLGAAAVVCAFTVPVMAFSAVVIPPAAIAVLGVALIAISGLLVFNVVREWKKSKNENQTTEVPQENLRVDQIITQPDEIDNPEIIIQEPLPEEPVDAPVEGSEILKKLKNSPLKHFSLNFVNDDGKAIHFDLGKGSAKSVEMNLYEGHLVAVSKTIIDNDSVRISQEVFEAIKSLNGTLGVLPLYEMFKENNDQYLISKLCNAGSLFNNINDQGKAYAIREQSDLITQQLFTGLLAIHQKNLVHHDIKLENVFLDKNADGEISAYLGDFDTTHFVTEDIGPKKTTGMTKNYRAPETYTDNYDEQKAEVFSFGLVLAGVLCGGNVLNTLLLSKIEDYEFNKESLFEDYAKLFDWSVLENNAFEGLLRSMLAINPDERCTLQEAFDQYNAMYEN